MKKYYLFTLATAMCFVLISFQQKFNLKDSIERGKGIYATQCMSCHMEQGEGLEGVFPPLAKTDYLNDKARLVKVVLLGVRGPMTINGVAYDGEMTGFTLSDEEVADVINYIRNSWGNKGAAITPAEIQPALKIVSKNYQAY